MLNNITTGFKRTFSMAGKILLLLALCIVLGVGIVFPLWKWASTSPSIYSWVLVALILVGLVYLVISSLKKKGGKAFFFGLLKILVAAGGLSFSIYLVLKGNRVASLIVFIVALILFGVLVSMKSVVAGKGKNKKN